MNRLPSLTKRGLPKMPNAYGSQNFHSIAQQLSRGSRHPSPSIFSTSLRNIKGRFQKGISTYHSSSSISQKISDVSQMSENDRFSVVLSHIKDFDKRVLLIGHMTKQSQNVLDEKNSFVQLFNQLQDNDFINEMPLNLFHELLDTFSMVIFSEKPAIPDHLIYSDAPLNIMFSNHEEYSLLLDSFSTVVHEFSAELLEKWITTNFILKFVKLLDTPDVAEQRALEKIIVQLALIFSKERDQIFNFLFNLIQDYFDDLIPHFCVSSALFCISQIYGISPNSVTNSHINILLHSFNSRFLNSFYPNLNIILKKLYCSNKNDNLEEKVRDYLTFHWPNKDSQNHYFFLHHYIELLKGVQEDDLPKFKNIINKFYDCILSANLSTALQATSLVGDPIIYKMMMDVSHRFNDGFLETIKQVRTDWSPFMPQAITESLKKIDEMNYHVEEDKKTKERPKDKEKRMNWETIKKFANANI